MTENVLAWINAGWIVIAGSFDGPGTYGAAIVAPYDNPDPPPVFATDGTVQGAITMLEIMTPLPPLPLPPLA